MIINHKVSFIAVCVFLITSLTVNSQNAKIDSLKSIVETAAKDTAMVSTLNNLGLELLNQGNIDELLKYSEKARALSIELGYIKGKALSLKYIGIAYYYKGDFLQVFDYWTQSLHNFEIIKDSIGISNILNNMGSIYLSQGSNIKAIDYFLRSLRIAEKIKHPLRISSALLNMGAAYGDSPQDWDKALSHYEQVLPYLNILNDPGISKGYYFGVGEIEYSKGNYQRALEYFEVVVEITKNTIYYTQNLLLLGKTKFKLGELEESLSLLNECYLNAVKEDNLLVKVKCLIELGIIYQNNNFKKAINTYREAEKLAINHKLSYELAQIYDGISQSYVNNGDFKKGYQYQKKFLVQKDSLFNLETSDKMRGLQFEFDLVKKENKISLLEKVSEISQLKNKKQKYVIFGTSITLILVFLLAIVAIKRYRYVKRTNRVIKKELRHFIETANAPIFGIDSKGLINEWNQTSEEITGFTKDDVLGKDLVQTYITEDYRESVKKVLDLALIGEETANYEFPLFTKEGERIMILLNSSTCRNAVEKITGVLGVGQDITELVDYRKGLELKVNEKTLKLEEALNREKELNALKSRFISIASHEFRTPLSAINFAAGSIKKYWGKMEPIMREKKLDKIEDQVMHMTELLDDILIIGQAEAGKFKNKPLNVNLGAFIDEIIEEVYISSKKSHEILVIDNEELKSSDIFIDEKLGRNIFINLLSNAVKFSPDAKKVIIELSSEKDYVIISVTDFGIGIPKSELKSIFKSFFRGKNVDLIQGTGLGLSIVKEAVDVIGGKIIVKSDVGNGTSFIVKTPKS